jgi:hypothetical protein
MLAIAPAPATTAIDSLQLRLVGLQHDLGSRAAAAAAVEVIIRI